MNMIANVRDERYSGIFSAVQIVLGSLLIALCAQINIPISFSPVTVTLQTLAVMLVGASLGSRKGALCVLVYLSESMLGLPVLHGGQMNPLALIGPNGGYLAGFVLQAYLVGWYSERRHTLGKSVVMIGMSLACALQLFAGTLWIGQFIGYSSAFMMGFMPFIPGEILKILVVVNYLYRNDSTIAR
jgi:biotin transport system substrate-specific component